MKVKISHILLCLLLQVTLQAQKVISIRIDGTINPASAGFIHDAIQEASDEHASCLLIHLNTPGGLLKSTRNIVADILEAEIPVVVYVSPAGSHAGSAGVFITLAAHVAAMAPGTNIGAAHPVSLQGAVDSTMNEKMTNDAVAFVRTIAEERKRNVEWAEKAVKNSVSITEFEALQNNVVDIIASNDRDLLQQLDGREVRLNSSRVTLQTSSAEIERREMSFAEKLLNMLSDPNVAYVLMMIGFYGILFELYNPSVMVPGIVGGICLILAFYSMHTLPVNYAGVALIIFGIILFLLEIKIVSYGMLTIGGVVSVLLGSLMLIKKVPGMEFLRVSLPVIITSTAITALFFLVIIGVGLRAQKLKPTTGAQGLLDSLGECINEVAPTGTVRVKGELWNARTEGNAINAGDKIKVVAVKGLTLIVEQA